MSAKPQVSVIITTFKRPQFLREAIRSVLSQKFEDFELIVVNDDPSGAEIDGIVSSFKDSRIFYIKNKENFGSARSLNVGLNQAKGDYIAILDDDDAWISKEKLGRQVEFLDRSKEYVLVGTNTVVVDAQSGKEIVKSQISSADEELRKSFFRSNPFAHSSVMFRKEKALEVGGYDESLPRGKDYDLWLKLAKKGKVSVLPDYFLKYREATFKDRNLVRQRYKDAKWTLEVMKRHYQDFSNTQVFYLLQWLRYSIFKILLKIPFVYKIFKTLRLFL
ncbi:MAG: glycosyltransferase [Patescibacteria group bacterium]|nr:glycosyltransferase [Patescibacteria group bacterium]